MALLLSKTRSDHKVNNPRQVVTEQRKLLSYQDILTSRTSRILQGNKKITMLFWCHFETSQDSYTLFLLIHLLIYFVYSFICYSLVYIILPISFRVISLELGK